MSRYRPLSRSILPIGLVLALFAAPVPASQLSGRSTPVRNTEIVLGAPALMRAALASTPAIRVGLYFEIGYTVNDINAAATEFTDALGVGWNPIITSAQLIRFSNGQVQLVSFQTTESTQGPPYYELAHADVPSPNPDNPWVATDTFSPTHVGYVVNDLALASDALAAAGWPRIATVDAPGGAAAVFAYHRGPGGIMVELVDRAAAPSGACVPPDSRFCPPLLS